MLDSPADTGAVDRFGFVARGWVWLGASQEKIAAVEAWSGTTFLGETGALAVRPDVCAALNIATGSRTGFELIAHHPTIARGRKFILQVRIRFRDGGRTDPLCERPVNSLGSDEAAAARLSLPEMAVATGDRTGDQLTDTAPFSPSAPVPPEHLQIRQVAGVWGPHFYREGRVIMRQLGQAFAEAGRPLEQAAAILDFGCGCGRVLCSFEGIRHTGEIWGCDIDAEAIAWNQQHLSHIGRFQANPVIPPTGFANGYFDAVYSVSVFTHLPEELQFAWLTELRRILRPGGVLVASVHGAHYWCNGDGALRDEVALRGFAYRTGQRTAGLPDYYMVAFHSESYVRTKWGRFFDLVAFKEKYIHGVHDAVVMRRPPGNAGAAR